MKSNDPLSLICPGLAVPTLIILSVLLALPVSAQSAMSRLLNQSVYAGDIAELVIQYDNAIPSLYALDTTVLDADFELLNLKSKTARVQENNRVFHRMQWKIELLPRRTGLLVIPALGVGDTFTPQLQLEVLPVDELTESEASVFIENEIDAVAVSLGQQVNLVTRLFYNTRLIDSNLQEPDIADMSVYRNGQEMRYSTVLGGKPYEVIERRLNLFPERSGKIVIPPALLRGTINQMRPGLSDNAQTKRRRISRSSNEIILQVREPPADYSARPWLPAKQLNLSLYWEQEPEEIRAGDSVGLRIAVEARGLPAGQLPEDLAISADDSIRVYADQATRSNKFDGNDIIGRLEQRYVALFTRQGRAEFPALKVNWWQVDDKVIKTAVTPKRVFRVLEAPTPGTSVFGLSKALRPGLITVSILLLLTLMLLLNKACRIRLLQALNTIQTSRRCRRKLKTACLASEASTARSAIVDWARDQWPDQNIVGLKQVDRLLHDPELSSELKRLDSQLFSNHGQAWDGRLLWQRLAQLKKRRRKTITLKKPVIPELYRASA